MHFQVNSLSGLLAMTYAVSVTLDKSGIREILVNLNRLSIPPCNSLRELIRTDLVSVCGAKMNVVSPTVGWRLCRYCEGRARFFISGSRNVRRLRRIEEHLQWLVLRVLGGSLLACFTRSFPRLFRRSERLYLCPALSTFPQLSFCRDL